MELKYKYVIASSVGERDGIGIEAFLDNELIAEIFRNDIKRIREITLYKPDIPLEDLEEFLYVFRQEIPNEFMD